MTQLRLFLLGTPRIELDGRPVETDRRKAIALLAYLAVTAESHTRDALSALFWPDSDQSRAYAYLRRTLWELNNVLGEQWLDVDREQVKLHPEAGVWLDVAEFRARLADCPPAANPVDCVEPLSAATALYRGDFLAGFSPRDSTDFDDWQRFQADSLRRDLTAAFPRLIQGLTAQADWETALAQARRWLTLDEFNEVAHREVMRLYACLGQRAAAVRQYESCVQLLTDELGIAPQPETEALLAAIKAGEIVPQSAPDPPVGPIEAEAKAAAPGRRPFADNLPTPPTQFVGRRAVLDEIGRLLLAPERRLMTLIGPGGIGKTRLAIQVAAEKRPDFPDGVCFVPLAPLRSTRQLLTAIANGLNFRFNDAEMTKTPAEQLQDYLQGRKLLLLLDNFEHLLQGNGSGQREDEPLLTQLLTAVPGLKILVTSRERLHLQGETVYTVDGMDVPALDTAVTWQRPDDAVTYSSVGLFVESARRVQPNFQLEATNLLHIIRICHLVDGMPLGIELAAGWIEMLSPAEIRAEIAKNLDFLETELRDVPARQRSIRAVFDSSWQMLTPAEQATLRQISIFTDTFTREAAQYVAQVDLRPLLGLVNKSLLRRDENGRYQIHELLRQYAAARLQQDTAVWQEAKVRYATYYLNFLTWWGQKLTGSEQTGALQIIEREREHIRVAWLWAVEHNHLTLVDQALKPLFYFYMSRVFEDELAFMLEPSIAHLEKRNDTDSQRFLAKFIAFYQWFTFYFSERSLVVSRLRQALDIIEANDAETRLGLWYVLLAAQHAWLVDLEEGLSMIRRSLNHLRQQENRADLGLALHIAGQILSGLGRRQEAREMLNESLEIYRQIGNQLGMVFDLQSLAEIDALERRYDEAVETIHHCQDLLQAIGNTGGLAFTWAQLGDTIMAAGDYRQAIQFFQEARHLFAEIGYQFQVASMYSWESIATLRAGDYETALELRQKSLAVYESTGSSFGVAWCQWEMGEIYRVMGDLGQARQWYDKCLPYFQRQRLLGVAFYHRGLGDLALMRGDYEAARQAFQESFEFCRQDRHDWGMAYALAGLGQAHLESDRQEEARRCFVRALQGFKAFADTGLALMILVGLARWLAANGDPAQAAATAAVVQNHHATWQELRDKATAVYQSVAAQLPAPQLEKVLQESKNRRFEDVIAELLADLASKYV